MVMSCNCWYYHVNFMAITGQASSNVVLLNGRFGSIGNYAHGMVWYCHYCPRASIAIIAHGPFRAHGQ